MRVEPRSRRRANARGTELPHIGRKPVVKVYGAKSVYRPSGSSAYEQRRAAKRAAG
jgi:hypothetical protein